MMERVGTPPKMPSTGTGPDATALATPTSSPNVVAGGGAASLDEMEASTEVPSEQDSHRRLVVAPGRFSYPSFQRIAWSESTLPSGTTTGHYQKIRELRNCQFGKLVLYKALGTESVLSSPGTSICVKQLDKAQIERRAHCHEKPLQEIRALQELSIPGHDAVMQPLEYLEDDHRIHIVMPFYAGDLLDFMGQQRDHRINEPLSRNIFRQLLSALEYIHGRQICLRDISPEVCLHSAPRLPS